MKKFDVRATALALATVWGLVSLIAGWAASNGWCDYYVEVMSSCYIGYAPTFVGGIIGGIWGFVEGLVVGWVFAHAYNYFTKAVRK